MSCAVAVIIADLGLTAARRTWLGATTRSLVVISAGVRPAAVASDTLAWAARVAWVSQWRSTVGVPCI